MSRSYVALMIFALGFALFLVANAPDSTPAPDVTTYSSSAWDFHNPIPDRVMPANPDTLPTESDSSEAETQSQPTVPDAAPADPERTGDDNGDGRIDEDESGWDCRTMGNGECGEGATLTAEDGSQVPVSFYDK